MRPVEASRSDRKVWRGSVLVEDARNKSYLFLHIPKNAGVSFMHDSSRHLPIGSTLRGSREKALFHSFTLNLLLKKKARLIIMLRHPVKLALSQFIMCKYVIRKKDKSFPRGHSNQSSTTAGILEWIQRFQQSSIGSQHCYNPINVQTRFLSTQYSAISVPKNLKLNRTNALHVVQNKAFFVGIADAYPESMCAFFIAATGGNPPPWDSCFCNKSSASSFKASHNLNHITHKVPKHSIKDLDNQTRDGLRRLVSADLGLYAHALIRFENDLIRLSSGPNILKQLGSSLICQAKLSLLWNDLLVDTCNPAVVNYDRQTIVDIQAAHKERSNFAIHCARLPNSF